MPLELPKLSPRAPIIGSAGRSFPAHPVFLEFMEKTRTALITAVADIAGQVADIAAALAAATAAEAAADAAETLATAADGRIDDVLDGTASHTALNVNGVNVAPFLGHTNGTHITDNSALGDEIIDYVNVIEGALTPSYSAYSAGAVSWVASSAEQTVQTVTVEVARGAVKISAGFNVENFSTSSGWFGRFRLYRDATELTDAEQQIGTILQDGAVYGFPSQVVMVFLDEPTPGTTYDYEVTFTPGASMTADFKRRSLIIEGRAG